MFHVLGCNFTFSPVCMHPPPVSGCSQMIADVEPLSGIRRYPSLSLGASWERHILSQQPTVLPKQGNEQQDMMTFNDEVASSPGLLAFHCPDDATLLACYEAPFSNYFCNDGKRSRSVLYHT